MLSPLADAGTPVFSSWATSHGSEGPQSPEREPHPAWMSNFPCAPRTLPSPLSLLLSSVSLRRIPSTSSRSSATRSSSLPAHCAGIPFPFLLFLALRKHRLVSSACSDWAHHSPQMVDDPEHFHRRHGGSTSPPPRCFGSIRGDDTRCKHRRQLGEGRLWSRVGGRPVGVISLSLTTFP